MRSRIENRVDGSSLKLLLWTAIAGLIFGLIAFGEPLEDALRTLRNNMHWHNASGDIILVKIDDEAVRDVGAWPWPRRNYARLTDELTRAGAKRIFFDLPLYGPTNPTDDALFAQALKRSDRAVLAVKARSGPNYRTRLGAMPYAPFAQNAALASISAPYNYLNTAWRLPYAVQANGTTYPSFATLLANKRGANEQMFMVDYSIDPDSIPAVSAVTILKKNFDDGLVRGKDVLIGTTIDAAGDYAYIPGVGQQIAGVYVHGIGAETLKAGRPIQLGWFPFYILSLVVAAFALSLRSIRLQSTVLAGFVTLLLFGPTMLEARLIYADIAPSLFVTTVIVSFLAWRYFRQRGLVNAVSGLPNLNALRLNQAGRHQAMIAARIMNYAEIVSALPADSEGALVDQIVSRLSLGSKDRIFYQGDGGIFAWFEKSEKPFGHHIDALYALFRNPVRVDGQTVDLAISFGVEIGSGRSLPNRLASAIVAAEEAAHDGLKWKYHDPQVLEDASWKLSMLSQLDAAIDKGEVWIAFQPQLDLKSRGVVGAEALARWTHPEKGPIAASEFVAAAEQHDRIGKLTDFVLEKAVIAAAEINRRGLDFNVAVNLSARLLTDKQFTMRVAALLARHGLAPQRLTLELTETTELADGGEALDMLTRLRDLGIEISIDDYGTGLSTLDYLKKIPASEIKIDQSFVKGLCDNRSDRLMVHSTIGLAHSLERRVVAEGVEDNETLDALIDMECDLAQGFIIGRPMSLESLLKRVLSERGRNVA